jgi:hypothetical protein
MRSFNSDAGCSGCRHMSLLLSHQYGFKLLHVAFHASRHPGAKLGGWRIIAVDGWSVI